MESKVKALNVRVNSDGQYDGQTNATVADQIRVGSGHSVTIDHFEKIQLAGNDVVTLLDSGDKGVLQLSVNGDDNSVFLANAQDYNASLKGGSGATITGVAGANLVLHGQSTDSYGHAIAFDTDGTINVSGVLSKASVEFTSLQGDATVDLYKGHADVSFVDQASYSVGGSGEIVISENGHSVTVNHNAGESFTFHDASGDAFTYAKLVGVIADHGGAFIG